MDCAMITEQMVMDFHFGGLDVERRQSFENHLVQCDNCLRDYFAVKQLFDVALSGSPDLATAPSNALRARIRDTVSREFAPALVPSSARSKARLNVGWSLSMPSLALSGVMAALAVVVWMAWPKASQIQAPVSSSTQPNGHSSAPPSAADNGSFETDAGRSLTDVEGLL